MAPRFSFQCSKLVSDEVLANKSHSHLSRPVSFYGRDSLLS